MQATSREGQNRRPFTRDIARAWAMKSVTPGRHACAMKTKPWFSRALNFPRGYFGRDRTQEQGRSGQTWHAMQSARAGRPTCRVHSDEDTRAQTLFSGIGELHLEIMLTA